jgi:hypothetical protein
MSPAGRMFTSGEVFFCLATSAQKPDRPAPGKREAVKHFDNFSVAARAADYDQ